MREIRARTESSVRDGIARNCMFPYIYIYGKWEMGNGKSIDSIEKETRNRVLYENNFFEKKNY